MLNGTRLLTAQSGSLSVTQFTPQPTYSASSKTPTFATTRARSEATTTGPLVQKLASVLRKQFLATTRRDNHPAKLARSAFKTLAILCQGFSRYFLSATRDDKAFYTHQLRYISTMYNLHVFSWATRGIFKPAYTLLALSSADHAGYYGRSNGSCSSIPRILQISM